MPLLKTDPHLPLHSLSASLFLTHFSSEHFTNFYIFLLLLSSVCLLPLECKVHDRRNFCLCCSLLFSEHLIQCLAHTRLLIHLKCLITLASCSKRQNKNWNPVIWFQSLCSYPLYCTLEITFSLSASQPWIPILFIILSKLDHFPEFLWCCNSDNMCKLNWWMQNIVIEEWV